MQDQTLDAQPSPRPRRMNAKRLWILLGGLTSLALVHVLFTLHPEFRPGFLEGEWGWAPALERCMTVPYVESHLGGKTFADVDKFDSTGNLVMITLDTDKISNLKVWSGGDRTILVRFDLDYEGQQCLVEGSFLYSNNDSPEMHRHSLDGFDARIVSRRKQGSTRGH